jgi:hypothetical protein
MDITDDLTAILEGKIPNGRMFVRTTHGSSEVELFGTNKRGFRIPLDRVEGFVEHLMQTCTDSQTLYRFGENNSVVEIPGSKVSKAAHYLRQARDIGVQFADYQQLF